MQNEQSDYDAARLLMQIIDGKPRDTNSCIKPLVPMGFRWLRCPLCDEDDDGFGEPINPANHAVNAD